jgi:hypothetical protein
MDQFPFGFHHLRLASWLLDMHIILTGHVLYIENTKCRQVQRQVQLSAASLTSAMDVFNLGLELFFSPSFEEPARWGEMYSLALADSMFSTCQECLILVNFGSALANLRKERRALRHWTNLMSTMRPVMEWGAYPSTRPSCTLDELHVVVPSPEPSKGHSIGTPNPSLPYAASRVDWHNSQRL